MRRPDEIAAMLAANQIYYNSKEKDVKQDIHNKACVKDPYFLIRPSNLTNIGQLELEL